MSKINTLRESIDTKLDQWQAAALSLEAQFDLTRDKALDRVEAQKQRFRDSLNSFKSEIEKSEAIADDIKSRITTQIDQMQVQLALGKAEARDAYESQKSKIQIAIAEFVNNIDRDLDAADKDLEQSFDAVAQKMLDAANALDAELDAMQAQFEIEQAKTKVEYAAKKNELTEKINWFKSEVTDKKQLATDKASGFEKDLSSGLAQIKQAFSNLRH